MVVKMVLIQNYFKNSDKKNPASTPFRYLLKQIKGNIYIVEDKNVLEGVEERLEKTLQIMKSHCLSDFGFLVNSSLEKPVSAKRSNSNHEKLPHETAT